MPAFRRVLLVQLPIPPLGHEPVRGNVPLAAGYLALHARQHGLASRYAIDIFPPPAANTLGDQGLLAALLDAQPDIVGFTCYLWNIERTLWLAEQMKARRPEVLVVLGGPEITLDNAWVLEHPAVDFAVLGEGEATWVEWLEALNRAPAAAHHVAGVYSAAARRAGPPRRPLGRLDDVSSPYLAGILDAADERLLLLETVRGCVFRCKFCYYPKSYEGLYFLGQEKLRANLRHARQRGAEEVVLLDPTLNQRRDFAAFLRILGEENPDRQFTYFGELRAEGITPDVARLLANAPFNAVEIGLQSIDPRAMDLMDRNNNLRAFQRGVQALREAGIDVQIDLIIGLPGDTVDSVRRGLDFLHQQPMGTGVQVFNLAVLPGTAFRHEAAALGLQYQPRPPYYVLETPTLRTEDLYTLMAEAQERFATEFDPLPEPCLEFAAHDVWPRGAHRGDGPVRCWMLDGPHVASAAPEDAPPARRGGNPWQHPPPPPEKCAAAFTVWARGDDWQRRVADVQRAIDYVLEHNPHTTLQVVLQPAEDPARLTPHCLAALAETCFARPTYLDKFYSILPGGPRGAKRLVVLLEPDLARRATPSWRAEASSWATVVVHLPGAAPRRGGSLAHGVPS
jgi:radical SAM superfamily enzyme YgiQ (UPF0313 family)